MFVLLLTGPLGLAESFFMLRLGLGHELRILRRVRFLQILDVPQKRLILLINLGDGCGCGIGVGQNILHPLEVGFLLHRLTQLFHLGGGEFGVLGNLRQLFLNLDLFKFAARLSELGKLFVVSGKSLGSAVGGGFGRRFSLLQYTVDLFVSVIKQGVKVLSGLSPLPVSQKHRV